jgi:sugar/nucleoside kinase (ribokinase family)
VGDRRDVAELRGLVRPRARGRRGPVHADRDGAGLSTIAVVGNLAIDRVAGAEPRAGGGVYWAARAAAHVGADAAVATRCAPEDRETALRPLEVLGLPVVCGDASRTTRFSFHYEGDHRVMTVDAVGDAWAPADAEWVQVAGLLRTDFPAETIAALARDGRRLLLDAQGVVRLGTTGPLAEDANVDPAIFRELAILTMNELEAQALVGGTDPERLRSLGVAEVVLTRASRGAVAVTGGQATEIPAVRVEGAVDPTGAGDSFALVYLEARSRGAEPAEAGAHAARVVAELIARP